MIIKGELGNYELFQFKGGSKYILPIGDKDFIKAINELAEQNSESLHDNLKEYIFHIPYTKSKWFPMINELYKREELDHKKLIYNPNE